MRLPSLPLPPQLRFRFGKNLRKGLLISAATLLAIAILGFLVAPPLVKKVAADQMSAALGRKVEIGKMDINPFALSVTVQRLAIYEPDQKHTTLTIGELHANASLASLLRLAPVLDEIRVVQPTVRIVRTETQRFNFSDVLDKLQAQPSSNTEPTRFSLNNIQILQGSLDYDDQVLQVSHRITDLRLTLPFLSTLPYAADRLVAPALSATIDGAPFALQGQSKPFSPSRQSALEVQLDGLSLPGYLPFLPVKLNAQLASGLLDAHLKLSFQQTGAEQRLLLSGSAALRDLQLRHPDQRPLLQWRALSIVLGPSELLSQAIRLQSIKLDSPEVHLTRQQDGNLDFLQALLPPQSKGGTNAPLAATATAAADPTSPATRLASTPASTSALASAALPAPPTTPARPLQLTLAHAEILDGRLHFRDVSMVGQTVQLGITRLTAQLDQLSTDAQAAPATLRLQLETDAGETLTQQGTLALGSQSMQGILTLQGLRPQRFQPYFAQAFTGQLGSTEVDATLPYQLAWAQTPLDLQLQEANARLRKLQVWLPKQTKPGITANEIAIEGVNLNLAKHTLEASTLLLKQAAVAANRDEQGRLDWQTALPGTGTASLAPQPLSASSNTGTHNASRRAKQAHMPPPSAISTGSVDSRETTHAANSAAWQMALKRVQIEQSAMRFTDGMVTRQNDGLPAVQQLSDLNLSLTDVRWPAAASPSALTFSLRHNQRGSLSGKGTVALQPLGATLQLDARNLQIPAFQPYFADHVNAVLSSGGLSTQGRLMVKLPEASDHTGQAAPRVSYQGSLNLGNLRARDKLTGDEFVRWKSLYVGNIDAQLNTRKPPLALSLGNVALADFYARIIVNANGQLNLQDIVVKDEQTDNTSLTRPAQAGQSSPASTVQTPASAPTEAPLIRVGQITVQGGNINFTDNLIKPNYSANLTRVSGSVSAVATDNPAPADITLKGEIDGDAPVEISGRINPLVNPLFVDVSANAKGIELTRLTPYSAKYAGYPITKGKLSMDVKYYIADGKLKAENRMFLDQLTFGEKVDSPDAIQVPVLLAVALLKNSRGEIDINLPVAGSLSDPEFSIGGVIFRVLMNLLGKAITSPFSLLASAFGGGDEEMGSVSFAAGESTLSDAEQAKLKKLAASLLERPTLKLDITGRADAQADHTGVQHAYLLQQVKAQKLQDLVAKGSAILLDDVTLNPDEYAKYLERAYKTANFPKPRNVLGLTKSLPDEEMEKLIMANAPVNADSLRALADRRALLVKKTLEQLGNVPNARLFLNASQLSPPTGPGSATQPAGKTAEAATNVTFSIRQ